MYGFLNEILLSVIIFMINAAVLLVVYLMTVYNILTGHTPLVVPTVLQGQILVCQFLSMVYWLDQIS